MRHLAETVLDYFWCLEFSEDDEVDPDFAVKRLENLSVEIEEEWSDEERFALQEAATRRLAQWLREPDEDGYTPRLLLTPEKKQFLENIAAGRFDGSNEDETLDE